MVTLSQPFRRGLHDVIAEVLSGDYSLTSVSDKIERLISSFPSLRSALEYTLDAAEHIPGKLFSSGIDKVAWESSREYKALLALDLFLTSYNPDEEHINAFWDFLEKMNSVENIAETLRFLSSLKREKMVTLKKWCR